MAPAKTALFAGAHQTARHPVRRGLAGNPGFPRAYATSASGLKLAAFGITAAGSVPIQLPSSSV